jgi:plasmid stabilization system protein ParE
MRVALAQAAVEDLEAARDWYDREHPGLGVVMLAEARRVLDVIADHPLRHRVVHRNTRRALLKRFPYGFYYRVDDEVVVVLAFIHGSRHPRSWLRRRSTR